MNSKPRSKGTPLLSVVWNLALVYVLFLLCRLVFMWYNIDVFRGNVSGHQFLRILQGGLKFDTAGILYLTALYIVLALLPLHWKEHPVYYRVLRVLLIVFASAGVMANLIDTVYFPFTGCRSTLAVFSEFSNEGAGQMIVIFLNALLQNWYLVLLFVLMVWALCRFTVVPSMLPRKDRLLIYYPVKTGVFVLAVYLIVIGIRGGALKSIRPITMSNAYTYADRPADAAAVLNTPFCAIRTIGKKTTHVNYFSQEELEQIYTPVIVPDSTAVPNGKNVVLLIMESFGGEYVGYMNRGLEGIHDCTPFLDSLMEHSLTFEYSMANGRKSIDAIPSAISGIPMLKDNFILTGTMMSKPVTGAAGLLGNIGYSSAFFHGADNQSMGFNSYTRATGFDRYYGRDEFDREPQYGGKAAFDGTWAIWDEEFLQFTCDKIGTLPQPFFAATFTASSHHPFNIPERYEQVFPREGNLPMYRCIRYSDNALRLFFEKASRQPWYGNTLFVIMADHTNQSEHPAYQSDYGQFRIPIVFFDPSDSTGCHRNCLAQQSDIMATILGYTGYDRPYICFGQNLLATPDDETWNANYQNGMYMYYKGDWLIKFDGEQLMGLYAYRTDPALRTNLRGQHPDIESSMLRQLKALIQQYSDHMTTKPLVLE